MPLCPASLPTGRVHSAAAKGGRQGAEQRPKPWATPVRTPTPATHHEAASPGQKEPPTPLRSHGPPPPDSLHPPVPLATASDLTLVVSRAQSEITTVATET